MSLGPGIAIIDGGGNALIDAIGNMIIFQPSLGTFLFLYDHYVDDEIIQAGEVKEMFFPWTPTADVEPMDATAVQSFYNAGPQLGAVIRTHWQTLPVPRPTTFWYQSSPNYWLLSGLGTDFAPVFVPGLGRIEDK